MAHFAKNQTLRYRGAQIKTTTIHLPRYCLVRVVDVLPADAYCVCNSGGGCAVVAEADLLESIQEMRIGKDGVR